MTESVSGLSKDSIVRLHGVDIGRVSEIRIDPNNIERIEIFLKINKGVPIKKNMEAHTQMLGITGILSIEIDGGSNSAETLKPDKNHIPVIPTTPSWFAKTTKGIGGLAERLNTLLEKSQKLFDNENIAALSNTFKNAEKFTANAIGVEEKVAISLDEFNRTLEHFRTKMDTMTLHFVGATDDFRTMKNVFNPTVEELMTTVKDFNRVTLKVEKSLDRGDYNLKNILEPMLVDIDVISAQINDLAKELEQSPNDLLFKSRKQRRGPGE